MSNYNITTNFGDKDSLPSGNAQKVVKGSEFTTEFTNIKTAVNSKADTAGDTFTGAVNFSADVAFNTDTLFVDVSTNRVGVGTTSPDTSLHVDGGDVKISSDSATSNGDGKPTIFFSESGADEVYAQISYHGDDESGTNNFIGIGCSGAVGTTEALMKENHQMVVKASGNVGIGTDSPASKLHVRGSDSGATGVADGTLIVEQGSAPSIQILSANTQTQSIKFGDPEDGDVGKISYSHADNHMGLFTDGTEAVRIDSSGNVLLDTDAVSLLNTDNIGGKGRIGVGTATPSYHVEVEQDTDTYIGFKTPNSKSNYIYFYDTDASTTKGIIQYSHPSDAFYFKVNGSSTNALSIANDNTIYASDRISVNESNPAHVEGRLHINVDNVTAGLSIDNTSSSGDDNPITVLDYQRNGTTVSSLRAQDDGSISYIRGIAQQSHGFGYQGTALRPMSITPVSAFGTDNGGSDLGTSTSRWGTVYLTTSPNVSSDQRLKENIADADDAGSTIDAICGLGSLIGLETCRASKLRC